MKAFTVFISLALAASVGMNVWLWQQRATQLATTEAGRAGAAEADALRAENETLKTQRTAKPTTADADVRELARLRNEIGQLRQQKTQADAQAAQAMAQLQAQVAGAKDKMEELKKGSEELLKMTPEQMTEARQRAQAIACVNNLKQIGLALRIYENAHQDTFPPDLPSLKNELVTPKVLFCPGLPASVQVRTWEELNPKSISYQFLNPNGNSRDPQVPLTSCPIHGNYGLSDGSVQMGRK